jgi:hypothetical protein
MMAGPAAPPTPGAADTLRPYPDDLTIVTKVGAELKNDGDHACPFGLSSANWPIGDMFIATTL